MVVAQDAAANAEHHRPVPADEGLERGLVAGGQELSQQLAVGPPGLGRRGRQPADVPREPVKWGVQHSSFSGAVAIPQGSGPAGADLPEESRKTRNEKAEGSGLEP